MILYVAKNNMKLNGTILFIKKHRYRRFTCQFHFNVLKLFPKNVYCPFNKFRKIFLK